MDSIVKRELIKIENLSLRISRYEKGLQLRQHDVIRDFHLTVNEGEIIAIVGASGSGKSLLASSLLGVLPANTEIDGLIAYKGKPLSYEHIKRLRGKEFMFIPQMVNHLNPLMKIGRQMESLIKQRNKKQQIEAIFDRVNLDRRVYHYYPHELSGGMTRKVFIAFVIASGASFIIADEPTVGLDSLSIQKILSELKSLMNENKSMLLITHDLLSAIPFADRIAIIYAGTTVEIVDALAFHKDGNKLAHPYTKALWSSLPENDFAPQAGNQPLATEELLGCVYADQCEYVMEKCRREEPKFIETELGMVRCFYAENK